MLPFWSNCYLIRKPHPKVICRHTTAKVMTLKPQRAEQPRAPRKGNYRPLSKADTFRHGHVGGGKNLTCGQGALAWVNNAAAPSRSHPKRPQQASRRSASNRQAVGAAVHDQTHAWVTGQVAVCAAPRDIKGRRQRPVLPAVPGPSPTLQRVSRSNLKMPTRIRQC